MNFSSFGGDNNSVLAQFINKMIGSSDNPYSANAPNNAGAVGLNGQPLPNITPIMPGSDAAVGSDGIRNPISGPMQPGVRMNDIGTGINNYTPTTDPSQMNQIPIAAGYTNPLPSPESIASQSGGLGGLGSALGGLTKAIGGGPSNTPGGQGFTPPQVNLSPYIPQQGGNLPAGFGAGAGPGGMSANPILAQFLKNRLGK